MTIRKKILVYFSTTVIALTAISLLFIYTLFAEYREEEFQQRQKEKIQFTLELLVKIKQMDQDIVRAMDYITIHDFYDEKMLIFNRKKELIYSSLDDLSIMVQDTLIMRLSPNVNWIETKEGTYDVIGLYTESGEVGYYGISKAYDAFGYSKLNYLRNVLIITFVMISFIVLAISSYLSSRITNPITEVAQLINEYDFEGRQQPVQTKGGGIEIQILTKRFNELMDKMQEAFAYQKHVVHHISHELKTPIAVLVSNFERMEKEPDPEKVRQLIGEQKEDTKKLSEIIHALLEIAKLETKSGLTIAPVRCDELIFDIVDELQLLYPDFTFTIDYLKLVDDEQQLTVWVNERLIRLALTNVLVNAIQYSHGSHASVLLGEEQGQLLIKIMNQGAVIQERERQFIFQHFFRGENSKGKRGFGLGLVLVNKILELHHGSIAYVSHYGQHNEFNITLPGMVFAQGMVPNTHSNST